jgi:hypothetical protein
LACGVPVTKTLRNIGCKSNLSGRIITWFYAEEDRKKKYLEARAVAAEILADEMLEIADGELDDDNPLPEDIALTPWKYILDKAHWVILETQYLLKQ